MAIAFKLSSNPKLKFNVNTTTPPSVLTGLYTLDTTGLGAYSLDYTNREAIENGTQIAYAFSPNGDVTFNYAFPLFKQEEEKAIQRLQEKYNSLNIDYKVTSNDIQLRVLTPVSLQDGTGISTEFYFYNVKDVCENQDFQLAISKTSEIIEAGYTYTRTPSCFTPNQPDTPVDEFEEIFTDELRYEEFLLGDGGTQINVFQRKALRNKTTGEVIPIEPPKFELVKTFIIPPTTPLEKEYYIYKRFAPSEIIQDEFIAKTYGVWGVNGELLDLYTSSIQDNTTKQYVINVVSSSCGSEHLFDIYYGDINGGGTENIQGSRNRNSYSKMIYSKYKNLCLEENQQFILNDGFSWPDTPNDETLDFNGNLFKVDSVYYSKENGFTQKLPTRKVNKIFAIKVPRQLYGDKLDEGNVEINFARLNPTTAEPLDEDRVFTLIDSSIDKNNQNSTGFIAGESYDMISGSIISGKYNGNIEIANTSYGKFYPNLGLLILDADKLNSTLTLGIQSGSNTVGDNPLRLFNSVSGSSAISGNRTSAFGFKLRKIDTQLTSYYHVNIRPKDFNYSNNPTFIDDTISSVISENRNLTGYKIKNKDFLTNPTSYITTVGLYDDNYQLLAVGKLSKAIKKTDVDKKTFVVRVNTSQI